MLAAKEDTLLLDITVEDELEGLEASTNARNTDAKRLYDNSK